MWWTDLSTFSQISFVVATTTTLILIIFLILMMVGVGGSDYDGASADVGNSVYNDTPLSGIFSLKLFNLRSILVLLSIGAWVAFLFDQGDVVAWYWALVIGFAIGLAAAILVAIMYHQAMKLESSGNINYNAAVGKTAIVYIRVPKEKSGKGKVSITLQDRLVQIDAMTNDKEDLLTNSYVEITDTVDENTVVVTKYKFKGDQE